MAKNNYNQDVVKLAKENENFRQVLFTTELSQLVLMSIKPGGDIGEETHGGIDQILSIVAGAGEAVIEGETYPVAAGSVVTSDVHADALAIADAMLARTTGGRRA